MVPGMGLQIERSRESRFAVLARKQGNEHRWGNEASGGRNPCEKWKEGKPGALSHISDRSKSGCKSINVDARKIKSTYECIEKMAIAMDEGHTWH
jgi:hypothetical protein